MNYNLDSLYKKDNHGSLYIKKNGNHPTNFSASYGRDINNGQTTITGTVSGKVGYPDNNNYSIRVDHRFNKDTSAYASVTKSFDGCPPKFEVGASYKF